METTVAISICHLNKHITLFLEERWVWKCACLCKKKNKKQLAECFSVTLHEVNKLDKSFFFCCRYCGVLPVQPMLPRIQSHTAEIWQCVFECEINMPLAWECFNISVCVCICSCLCVCVRFSLVQRPCVCVCVYVSHFYRVQLPSSLNQNQNLYCSHRFFLFAKPPSRLTPLPFLTNSKAPRWPPQAAPPSPTNYWSSFILLRAEPAWNHSICVSLKLWLRVMDSWLPSLCLITAVKGWTQEVKKKKDYMQIIHPVPYFLDDVRS